MAVFNLATRAQAVTCADCSMSQRDIRVRLEPSRACVSDEFADVTPAAFMTRHSSLEQTTQPAGRLAARLSCSQAAQLLQKARSQTAIANYASAVHDRLKQTWSLNHVPDTDPLFGTELTLRNARASASARKNRRKSKKFKEKKTSSDRSRLVKRLPIADTPTSRPPLATTPRSQPRSRHEFVGEKLPTGIKDEFDALKQRLAESD